MYLRPDVHLARVGPDVVLLDSRRGEYLCLVQAADAFEILDDTRVRIVDAALNDEAASLGLIGAGRRLGRGFPPAPARDLADVPDTALQPSDRVAATTAYGELLAHYYGRPFGHLVRHAARRPPLASSPPSLLAHRVSAFRQLLPWAPFPGVCLYRSFYLLAFLRRRGLDATWMFGVQTWPFEAHCWLQTGDLVLDDRVDRVRAFTPIMAV